jgi:hypothetical protein
MPSSKSFDAAAAATRRFLDTLPQKPLARVAAAVASPDGMGVLCAVEAVLREALPAEAGRELVWLTAGPEAGVHRLQLTAYAQDDDLVGAAAHEFVA